MEQEIVYHIQILCDTFLEWPIWKIINLMLTVQHVQENLFENEPKQTTMFCGCHCVNVYYALSQNVSE